MNVYSKKKDDDINQFFNDDDDPTDEFGKFVLRLYLRVRKCVRLYLIH